MRATVLSGYLPRPVLALEILLEASSHAAVDIRSHGLITSPYTRATVRTFPTHPRDSQVVESLHPKGNITSFAIRLPRVALVIIMASVLRRLLTVKEQQGRRIASTESTSGLCISYSSTADSGLKPGSARRTMSQGMFSQASLTGKGASFVRLTSPTRTTDSNSAKLEAVTNLMKKLGDDLKKVILLPQRTPHRETLPPNAIIADLSRARCCAGRTQDLRTGPSRC